MRALCLAVEDALRAVDVGVGSNGGGGEVAVPPPSGSDTAEVVLLDLNVFCDLLLLLLGGLGEFLFDRELDFDLRILSAGDGECAGEGQRSLRGRRFGV